MENMEYFDGIRYKCIAHYPLIADMVVEWITDENEAKEFVKRHNMKGANVEKFDYKWSPALVRAGWYPAKSDR